MLVAGVVDDLTPDHNRDFRMTLLRFVLYGDEDINWQFMTDENDGVQLRVHIDELGQETVELERLDAEYR